MKFNNDYERDCYYEKLQDFEFIRECKAIGKQLHDFDFLNTFPVTVVHYKFSGNKLDLIPLNETIEHTKSYLVGAIYEFNSSDVNDRNKVYYLRYFGREHGIAITEEELDIIYTEAANYYYYQEYQNYM
jgi:hypothetical protein